MSPLTPRTPSRSLRAMFRGDMQEQGRKLMTTLSGLGADFTADVHDAWAAAWTLLAETMKDAAKDSEAAA